MYAIVNGVRLFFDVFNPKLEVVGDRLKEKPVLICLHGGPGGDHQSLRPAFDAFSQAAQVVYFDQRGSGRSEHGSPEQWTLDQWADDLAAFCEALGIERPVVLGVSGGAIVVQAYLARYPRHPSAAILVNASARMDRQALIDGFADLGGAEAGAAARAMYERGAPEDVPGFFRYCLPFYSRRSSQRTPSGGTRTSFNFHVSQHFFGPGGEAFQFDHRQALGEVDCPVLVLAGAHDPVTRAEWALEIAQALPAGRAELVMFENASHLIPADEPERFFGLVTAFIEGCGGDR